jgi:hypothetical protein
VSDVQITVDNSAGIATEILELCATRGYTVAIDDDDYTIMHLNGDSVVAVEHCEGCETPGDHRVDHLALDCIEEVKIY